MTSSTLTASKWSSNTYSFEDEYLVNEYDIEIFPNNTCDEDQLAMYNNAQLLSSASENIVTALGDVPTGDIPIIIQVAHK